MSTIGKIIQSKRIASKISLSQASNELKISTYILKEIEADQNKSNYDIIFLIGHIRSYSNYLQLNSDEIIIKFKEQISYKKNDILNELPKPNFDKQIFKFQKFIPTSLIVIIFGSFYFLFVRESHNTLDYALVPDLPESYTPVIEKADLSNLEVNLSKDKNEIDRTEEIINYTSATASTKKNLEGKESTITLKILNSTWLQLTDESNNIVLSRLMEKNEEYSYNMSLNYTITSGNAGNVLVIIDRDVRGKIGKYGEVVDSIILDNSFNN